MPNSKILGTSATESAKDGYVSLRFLRYYMTTEPSRPQTKTVSSMSSAEARRYVLDFGPAPIRKEIAINTLEEWLANGSKYTGALLVRTPGQDSSPSDRVYVTAIELSMKVYTTNVGPEDEVGAFVRGRGSVSEAVRPSYSTEKLVLTDGSRQVVSEVVRSALAYTLGESGRDVMLSKLQLDYGFGFSQVTDYPGRFTELLNEILQGGARYVEERILQELETKYPSLKGSGSFKDAVGRLVTIDTPS